MLTADEIFEVVARPPENLLSSIAPEFDDYENRDNVVRFIIKYIFKPDSFFGDATPLAVAYKAAITMTIGGRDTGANGDVKSITQGDRTLTFASDSDTSGPKNYAGLLEELMTAYGSGMHIGSNSDFDYYNCNSSFLRYGKWL